MGRTDPQRPKSTPNIGKEQRKKKFPFLAVHSLMEVTSDEEGFKGAWFEAKILKSYLNRKRKLLIQYKNLVSEKDSNELLKETVDLSFIRPLPPPSEADQIYEVDDVVDVFHRDGWWKGVVRNVELRMCWGKLRRRYSVEFENPSDVFNYNGNALRFHHDWIGRKWIRSRKQKVSLAVPVGSDSTLRRSIFKVLPSRTHADEQSADFSLFVDSSTADNHAEDKSSVKKSRKNPVWDSSPSCATLASTNLKIPAPKTSPGPHRQEALSEDGMTESSKKRKREPSAEVPGYQIPTADDTTNEQPFVKSLYMWKHIDALEIFRILPQNPHFSFLSDSNEETRKGSAFGLMLTFASMAEKVTKLQIDDPRSRFDSYVDALAMLEVIGFDVKVMADRVNELWVLKEQKEQLDNRSKRYQTSVADSDARKAKLEQEIAEIDKMTTTTTDLVVQRLLKLSEMVTEDSKKHLLQLKISSLKIIISDLEDRFKVKSASSWQRVV
ncbi:DUF724 domain-containing protein 8-like [Euphorbia lathyris]|uniref:DUF724 domain-containing protein 8-like n=1 Tax=Euphorbia lathyris TaxID=212925 RepID=UPI0033134D71